MDIFKFIACSDLHIKKTAPQSRKDLYFSSIRRKLSWLFKLANDNNACIICGGDVFDNVSIPHVVIEEVIRLALKYNVKLLTVYGQHDLRYHAYSSHKNTPLAILLAAIKGYHLDEAPFINEYVAVQGASWQCSIPPPIKGKLNILATHRMVTEGGPLWPGHTGYDTVEGLSKIDYDIVVSGDNHKSFMHFDENETYVINSGSLVRSAISQMSYQPRVALCIIKKSKTINVEWHDVPVRDSSLVFKDREIERYNDKLTETKAQLQAFTDQLNNYKIEKPDFMYNVVSIKKTIVDPYITSALDAIILKVQQNR